LLLIKIITQVLFGHAQIIPSLLITHVQLVIQQQLVQTQLMDPLSSPADVKLLLIIHIIIKIFYKHLGYILIFEYKTKVLKLITQTQTLVIQ
jgi:hypothetical protein